MAKSRLIGSYPVIGIRPTIDGRRGALDVRGSLEEQTMKVAMCVLGVCVAVWVWWGGGGGGP